MNTDDGVDGSDHDTLFDQLSQGAFRQAADGTLLDVNPAALEMLGLTREEFLSRTSEHPAWEVRDESGRLLPADDHPSMVALRTGRSVRGAVLRIRHARTQAWRWLEVNAIPEFRSGSTAPFRATVTLHDVTALKQALERLAESDAQLRRLVAGLPDIVARFDRAGRHLFVSDNVEELARRPAHAFIGRTHRELDLPADLCAFFERGIATAFESGQPFETECVIDGQHGTRYYNWRLIPERDAGGEIVSLLSISRDLTPRRVAEHRYRSLFQEMLEGFALHEIICDESGRPSDYRFLAANPAFGRMTGLDTTGIVGRRALEVLPSLEPHWIEVYGRVALTGEPALFESHVAALDRSFEVRAFRPAPRQFACIFSDVTDRRRAAAEREELRQRLEHAQQLEAIGRLAGGVAHDFNNLLGVVIGHAEMALEQLDAAHPATEDITSILGTARRSADLTRQLLGFARRQAVTPKALDLGETVAGMLAMLRRLLGEHVELVWERPADLWPVTIDPSQVDQILANLCVNARDALQDRGRISIAVRNETLRAPLARGREHVPAGEYVVLSVADTGTGIDAQTLDRVFEPFFTTKPVGQGTGLGLATVYGIVRQNGGWIVAESEPGAGTTFTTYLPRRGEVVATPTTEAAVPPPRPRGGTLLVVEDDADLLRLSGRLLSAAGYRVLTAERASDALRLAREHAGDIDLLVTDVIMPEMHGRELARRLRELRPTLTCLFVSGYTADVIAHQGVLDEGVLFLQKPYTGRQLRQKVEQALASANGDAVVD